MRRNEVLTKMAQLHYITPAQAQAAIASPLEVHHSSYYDQHRESIFFDYVTQQLIDRYGVNTVEQGGLRVYTTINLRYQQLARAAIQQELGLPGDPAAAVVTEDPRTGYILAMAQSPGSSEYNLAADAQRQPGSTMKAIDLADALEHGIDPDTTYFLSHTLHAGLAAGLSDLRGEDVRGHVAEQVDQPHRRPRSPPTTPSTRSWRPTWASRA